MDKEQAIELCELAQNKKVSSWSERATELLRKYAPTVTDFITEDFRSYAEENGLEKPDEPRAYGGIMRNAAKAGIIETTGKFRCMNNPKSHSCPKIVWKSK